MKKTSIVLGILFCFILALGETLTWKVLYVSNGGNFSLKEAESRWDEPCNKCF